MSGEDRLRLECVSNSSQPVNGSITTPSGLTLYPDNLSSIWNLNKPFNRPGVIRFRIRENKDLTNNEMGVYTCNIPDDNGDIVVLNVGLYPNKFNGWLSYCVYAICRNLISLYAL